MIVPRTDIAPALVADHYDELDRWYRLIWGEHVHHGLWESRRDSVETATRNLIDRVADRLELVVGARVCDVGCGYGGTARALAAGYDAQVTGVTLSEAQYAYARERVTGGNPAIFRMDFLDNRFDDGAFDAVLAIESTEHFEDKRRLFSEMFRILRPGGCVAVCAWLAKPDPAPWEVRWLLEPICREGRLPGMGTEDEYRALFERAGFEEVTCEDVSRQVARTWPIIAGRVIRRLTWDPAAWRFLLSGPRNIAFAKTVIRIGVAYRTGAMRYGIFSARKPGE